jgi:hypothetical protein
MIPVLVSGNLPGVTDLSTNEASHSAADVAHLRLQLGIRVFPKRHELAIPARRPRGVTQFFV